jgi:GWxTD domain-containing protein
MKQAALFLFFLTVIFFSVTPARAQHLSAFMQNGAFLSTQTDTPYIETYITVLGKSVHYVKNQRGRFEGALQVKLMYMRDSNTVSAFDKYILQTPEIDDTTNVTFNLLDLRRVSLPDGDYTVDLEIQDVNSTAEVVKHKQGLNVHFNRDKLDFSSIELVENYSPTTTKNVFSKNGYDIKPFIFNYYPTSVNKIKFYNEIYNTEKVVGNEDVIITYAIRHAEQEKVVNELFRFAKQKAAPVNIVFSEFDITDLPSGNYLVQVQVKNKKNELLGEQNVFFQRFNKNSIGELENIALLDVNNTFAMDITADSLTFFLKSLYPKAEAYEREYILRVIQKNDEKIMRQFFYNFWKKRNDSLPAKEWMTYKTQVNYVDRVYKSPISYGFETDRGRVYLQYGIPNRIDGSDREPGAFPYEIWQYYKLPNGQTNVRFVFCNSDMVTNDYKLIHSEALGEIYDARWRFKIHNTFKDSNGFYDLDVTDFKDSWGSQVDDYFNNR